MPLKPLSRVPGSPAQFVLGTDVPLAWIFTRQATRFTDRVMWNLAKRPAVVSTLWPTDLVGSLLDAEQSGATTRIAIDRYLRTLTNFPIWADDAAPDRAFADILPLARGLLLSINDAAVIELAVRLQLPLASNEPPLVHAARTVGVPIYQP